MRSVQKNPLGKLMGNIKQLCPQVLGSGTGVESKKEKCSLHSMHSAEKLNQIHDSSLQISRFILACV